MVHYTISTPTPWGLYLRGERVSVTVLASLNLAKVKHASVPQHCGIAITIAVAFLTRGGARPSLLLIFVREHTSMR